MRVMHLTPSYPPLRCGIADYTAQLVQHLAAAGVHVDVVTSDDPAIRERAGAGAADEAEVHATIRRWDTDMWGSVSREVRALQPDVLHIHYQASLYEQHPAVLLLPWALRLQRLHLPIVTTVHEFSYPARLEKWRILRRVLMEQLLAGSSWILTGNEHDLGYVQRRQSLKARSEALPVFSTIPVAPLPVNGCSDLCQRLGISQGTQTAAFFGLLRQGKGIEQVLTTVRELRRSGPPVELLVVGDMGSVGSPHAADYRVSLEQMVETLQLTGHVHWLGHLPPSIASHVLQCVDVVVLPFSEGAATSRTSILGALAHGAPVVTTKSALTPAAFRDRGNMMLVPAPGDVLELTQAVREVLVDADLRARLREGAKQAGERFSSSAISQRILEIYQFLVTRQEHTREARRNAYGPLA